MIYFLIMQQTNKGLCTAIASDDFFEAMAESRPLWIYSLLKKIALAVLLNVFKIQRVKLYYLFTHNATN